MLFVSSTTFKIKQKHGGSNRNLRQVYQPNFMVISDYDILALLLFHLFGNEKNFISDFILLI